MVKIFVLITVSVALFCVYPVEAQSQRPTPSSGILSSNEKPQATEDKQHPKNDQRGTEQSPLIIKVAPSPNAQDEAAQAKKEKKDQAATNRRIEITTYAIAGGTILQAIALAITIMVMIRTTRRQLRAYINLKSASIYNVIDPIGPQLHIMFDNFGQTPAYDVVDIHQVCFLEFPLKESILDSDSLGNGLPIPPGKGPIPPSGGYDKIDELGRSLNPTEIASLKAGKTAIYIHGKITYTDTFGKKRFTKYRLRHSGDIAQIGKSDILVTCEKGNEAN